MFQNKTIKEFQVNHKHLQSFLLRYRKYVKSPIYINKQPLGAVLKRCSFLLADIDIFLDFLVSEEQLKMLH